MKTLLCLTWICAAVSLTAAARDHSAWQWRQAADITAPGMARLELPPATLDACQPSLADLRLIAPDHQETPWLLEETVPPPVKEVAATDFKATLDGRSTVLTAIHEAGEIEALTLQSPARDFLKSARVEGCRDDDTWTPLVTGEVVFRQAEGAHRLHIPLPPGRWPKLRVTLDDDRTPPVAFTGLRVTPVEARPETSMHTVAIRKRIAKPRETRLVLDLGAKNLHLAEIELDVPDSVFSRSCNVLIDRQTIATANIYRIIGGHGETATSLAIPLHQRIPTDEVTLIIANGDSPPLDIRGVSATRHPDRLLFYAHQTGAWEILTGNRHAGMPRYDLGALRDELTRAPGAPINPGPLSANPNYQSPTALPGVEPTGREIDVSDWGRRRAVHAGIPGVVRIELDVAALSHLTRLDLGDVRLVQDGRQVPWLRESTPQLHRIPVQVANDPDPKRPTVSRWKIATPSAGLPLYRIEIDSPDPLFTRDLRFIQHGKDQVGNPWTRTLRSETWTKAPGARNSRNTLAVPLGDVRITDAIWMETDNGDNSPIQLGNVRLLYRAPAIIAKITNDAPLFLYYDNPKATPPTYDLGLASAELLAADKQPATLGGEEVLLPGKTRGSGELSAGSPWLWAALALVVVVLLLIVAKLLPKPASPGTP